VSINPALLADVFVVAMPTPIDNAKRPDFTALEKASATEGAALIIRAAGVEASLAS